MDCSCRGFRRWIGRIAMCAMWWGIFCGVGVVLGDDPPVIDPSVVAPGIGEQMAEVDEQEREKKLEAIQSAVRLGRGSKEGAEAVRRGLVDRDEEVREAAVRAVLAIGGGVQELLPFLNEKNDDIRLAAAQEILAVNGDVEAVLPALFELRADEEYRNAVDDLFKGLNPKAIRKIARILIDQIKDETFLYRKEAGEALEQLGPLEPGVVSLLRELLQDKREEVRIAGAKTLSGLGALAREALPDLRRLLKTGSPEGQQQMAEAIGRIEPAYLGFVRLLILKQEEEAGQTGKSSAVAIDEKSPIPKDVVPGLMAALTDEELEIRVMGRRGLAAIGPGAGPGILKELHNSQNPNLWSEGCDVLRTMKLKSPDVVAELIAGLSSEVPGVQIAAAKFLEEIGPEGAGAVPGFLKMLNAKEKMVRAMGAQGLGKMAVASTEAMPRLTLLLKDESKFVRLSACRALFRLKIKPEVLLPTLAELMVEDENPQKVDEEQEVMDVRIGIGVNGDLVPLPLEVELNDWDHPEAEVHEAEEFATLLIDFMKEMGKSGEVLIPALIKGQGAKDLRVDEYGKRELCPLLPTAFKAIGGRSAIPLLISALKHPDPQVRCMAAESLGRIKPSTPEAVSALVTALGDDGSYKKSSWCAPVSFTVRSEVIGSLGRLGAEAASAVPALMTRLSVEEESEKQQIIQVLGKIGPAAREAVPVLWKMKDVESLDALSSVLLAIAQIAPDDPECAASVLRSLERIDQGELPHSLEGMDFAEICFAVVVLGERTKRGVPLLERMIEERQFLDPDSRCLAAGAVARVNPGNQTAMNFLKRMTQEENSDLYSWTARAQLSIIEGKGAEYED